VVKIEKEYYKQRDGSLYTKLTKKEINEIVDPNKPITFLPILKEMNYPFFESEWNKYIRFKKDNIFGRYIACMRLYGFKNYTWKDSVEINAIISFREKEYKKEKINIIIKELKEIIEEL